MKESKETPPMSDAQREIMEIVWERGEAGVGEVWRALAQRRSAARQYGPDTDHTPGRQGMAGTQTRGKRVPLYGGFSERSSSGRRGSSSG